MLQGIKIIIAMIFVTLHKALLQQKLDITENSLVLNKELNQKKKHWIFLLIVTKVLLAFKTFKEFGGFHSITSLVNLQGKNILHYFPLMKFSSTNHVW